MKILLCNDDGIHSPGLAALEEAFKGHDVWVVAPDSERSASSNSISLLKPVRFRTLDDRHFSCAGTPADCVLFALRGAIPFVPDVIISGINYGGNLGMDLIYSGTAAAARQGALFGIPSLAVSQCGHDEPFYFSRGAGFVAANLEVLVSLWRPDHFININVPNSAEGKLEARVTSPSRSTYNHQMTPFPVSNGDVYYYVDVSRELGGGEENDDTRAVEQGYVSVSPIFLFPLNHQEEEAYRRAEFRSVP